MNSGRLYVADAEYAGGVRLNILFSDGTSRLVDFKPFLESNPHPQYDRYINPDAFRSFSIENGNLVWGKNWDMIFPIEQLYLGSIK